MHSGVKKTKGNKATQSSKQEKQMFSLWHFLKLYLQEPAESVKPGQLKTGSRLFSGAIHRALQQYGETLCVPSKAAALATGGRWLHWNIASENKNWILNIIQLKRPPVANAHLCV